MSAGKRKGAKTAKNCLILSGSVCWRWQNLRWRDIVLNLGNLGKKEDNATIYQVNEIRRKLSTLLQILSYVWLNELLHFHQVLFFWTNQQFLNAQITQIYFSLSQKNHAMVHGWHNWDKRSRKLSWTKHSAEFMLMQQGHEEGYWGKFAQNSVCNLVGLELISFGIKHFTLIGISNIKRKREWFWYNLDSPRHFCYTSLSMQPFRCAYIHFSETNIWLDRKIVELGYMFHLISE